MENRDFELVPQTPAEESKAKKKASNSKKK
jgi:hypothetical protein